MSRLFLYGSLLDPGTLALRSGEPGLPARLVPAVLDGFRRVELRGTRWPTLVAEPAGRVQGAILDTGAAALRRLAAYEGPNYRLVRVAVRTAHGKTAALAWIAPGGTRRPWKEPSWSSRHPPARECGKTRSTPPHC